MKKRKVILSGIVIVLLCMAFFSDRAKQGVLALTMSSITSDSIRDKEGRIQQALDEKKALQNGLSDLQNMKKDLEKQRTNLKNYVVQLDGDLLLVEQNIQQLKEKIAAKEEELAQAQKELDIALADEENQKESMSVRIRMVYESGRPQMTDMFLKSSGFGDFLNKADHVERVVAYDQQMWEDFKLIREYVELCKQELELEKEILDETKAGVEEEERNLEALIDQKNKDITAYETDITNKEKAIKEYEAEIEAQENEIAALEAMIAEEKKKILASSGVVLTYDGGTFKFPMASYTRVSDDYGPRIHPTLGVQQFHNGVDLAAPAGTAIYAAYDGVVVAAAYHATMGNYVMIDHGSGLYTIYMHASTLNVAKDDIVVRGEKIAGVGTTGRSTGNHLHFTVRLNGEYQSPWNYISR